MTREEAIKELEILKEEYWDDDGYGNETEQYDDTMTALDMAIKALEQEPKTGHWIAHEVRLPDRTILNYRCSVCGRKLIGYSTETLSEAPYCHCGAKMESEE